MIISDLNILRSSICPLEDNPPLIVDADRMPSSQIALKGLKPIARRYGQVTQGLSAVELYEFAAGNLEKIGREALRGAALDQDRLGKLAPEAADQRNIP
jgi:hypothetical protein